MSSKEDTNMLISNHVTTKWTQDTKSKEYEVAVASALVDEASILLKGIRNYLIKIYDNSVREHFESNGESQINYGVQK